jgi:hypothetical protein
VSGDVSVETMTMHGGMAHLAQRGQAAAACGVPTCGLGCGSCRLRIEAWSTGAFISVCARRTAPPRSANQQMVCGGLAADRRAPDA